MGWIKSGKFYKYLLKNLSTVNTLLGIYPFLSMEIKTEYGKIKMNKLSSEIIRAPEFKRLKKITLSGYKVFLSPNNPFYKKPVTIFEHSIGVYALLTSLGANYEERIMGLLHDISRPAFGHIIDFLFGDYEKQEWHERVMESFLENSKINEICENHGLNLKRMVKKFRNGRYRYLDSPIPNICADRLDYSLRHIRSIFGEDLFWIARDIKKGSNLYFSSEKTALIYSLSYLELSRYYNKDSGIFLVISKILKKALEQGLIETKDFLERGEEEIYRILIKDRELKKILSLLKNIRVEIDEKEFDFVVRTKRRYVDPFVREKRLSEINKEFKRKIEEFLKEYEQGIRIKVYPKEILKYIKE